MSAFPMPSTVPFFGTLTQWAINTYYGVGQRVFNGGNIYVVTVGGESASSGTGPSGTGTGITDGGVTWNYVAAAYVAWAGSTAYAAGAIVSNGGNLYSCLVAGTSAASGGPTGTAGVITDGTAPTAVTWAYIGSAVAAQTMPTQKTADLGAVPGSPFFAQYFNWAWASVVGWILYLRDFLTGAHEWTKTQTFDEGIVVTNTDANSPAVSATGNGAGAGVYATGGATALAAVVGAGATGQNQSGISGSATGTGAGVLGLGYGVSSPSNYSYVGVAGFASTQTGINASGGYFVGHGSGSGASGIAGATGSGLYGAGAGSPGAVSGYSAGAGVIGNADTGPGLFGQSKSGPGAVAIGGTAQPGAAVVGGSGGGSGLIATAGSGNSDGVEAASSGTGAAFHATTGGVLVDSGNVTATTGNVAAVAGYLQSGQVAGYSSWASGVVYPAGAHSLNRGNLYVTSAGGTSGGTPPTWTSGSNTDGGVTWTYVSNATTPATIPGAVYQDTARYAWGVMDGSIETGTGSSVLVSGVNVVSGIWNVQGEYTITFNGVPVTYPPNVQVTLQVPALQTTAIWSTQTQVTKSGGNLVVSVYVTKLIAGAGFLSDAVLYVSVN